MRTSLLMGSIVCLVLLAAAPVHAATGPAASGTMPPRTVQFIRHSINAGLADMALSHTQHPSLERLLPYATARQRQSYRRLARANRYPLAPAPAAVSNGSTQSARTPWLAASNLGRACRHRPHPRRAPLCRGVPRHPVADPLTMPSTLLNRAGPRLAAQRRSSRPSMRRKRLP